MRVLILGGSGMLGHRLWIRLQEAHETWVTIRGSAIPFPDRPEFPRQHIYPNVDALVLDDIDRALAALQPDIVVNCIGLIKQVPLADDPLSAIRVNALLPHQIALICRTSRIRMIHISTDCVFSGRKGNYSEEDPTDALDLYGKTKALGEVNYPHTVTLRTSIIGRELKSKLGLIEWFLSQQDEVKGFTRAIFSGVTTDELGRAIRDCVIPNMGLQGVWHLSSNPISKYDLLMLAKEAFGHTVAIHPFDDFVIDRSLDSTRFRRLTGYRPPAWAEMIDELARGSSVYAGL